MVAYISTNPADAFHMNLGEKKMGITERGREPYGTFRYLVLTSGSGNFMEREVSRIPTTCGRNSAYFIGIRF